MWDVKSMRLPPSFTLTASDAANVIAVALEVIMQDDEGRETALDKRDQFSTVVMVYHLLQKKLRTSMRDIVEITKCSNRSVSSLMSPVIAKNIIVAVRLKNDVTLQGQGSINYYFLSDEFMCRVIAARKHRLPRSDRQSL
jgi:hypothetical protein